MPAVNFFQEEVSFTLKDKLKLKKWITETIVAEGYQLKELNYIFCSDEYLLQMNQQYLDHDTLTDIITFDNSEIPGKIVSDIFISIERIRENAKKFNVTDIRELQRVIIHGALHLVGYGDKKPADKKLMTEKEDFYLNKVTF
ncbi:rRNA maturation RNase YbeY [Mucilaginibacter polytrichastri]|uniref:Endoribonuclease YbeY n=1 Tax=Mucilaginibacter polytrichastri TaxID=1302689 RepID=A0A1Q6A4S2_9SPHI|nr:rRNA maturation RNase YbeY [Mucilaginibacter polytrichastri]OKS89005.1 putative rRNA maturation factor [Mucilaginibacter polytrichastri]SFS95320.1 rRNA maturation RNase YbeY [Mucilaginibacter polytrichastri]